MKVVYIDPREGIKIVETKAPETLIDGNIEMYPVETDKFEVMVDESGMLKDLQQNVHAAYFIDAVVPFVGLIYGPTLVVPARRILAQFLEFTETYIKYYKEHTDDFEEDGVFEKRPRFVEKKGVVKKITKPKKMKKITKTKKMKEKKRIEKKVE